MRALVVTLGIVVVLPGAASAQLAPRDQAQFEQRFTGWTLVSDAPDCNEGNGIDPKSRVSFRVPRRGSASASAAPASASVSKPSGRRVASSPVAA